MTILQKLWTGDLPLETAFWNYAVLGGIMVNLLTSAGFLFLMTRDQVLAAVMVGYGVSLPYNFFVTVAVWRAAARDDGGGERARIYPLVTLAGMLILSLV